MKTLVSNMSYTLRRTQILETLLLSSVIMMLCTPVTSLDVPVDKSVCSPPKVPVESPLPALGDVYSASIRWTSELDKTIYDVRDDYDKRRGQAALTVNVPRLPAAAKMIYDLKQRYISIIKDVTQRDCTVVQPGSTFNNYNGLPFLAGLSMLTSNMESARDLEYLGETTINKVDTDLYSACLYDPRTNTTLYYQAYFVGRLGTAALTWQMPKVPKSDRSLPYIIKLHSKSTQSGTVQEYKVTGTIGRFDVTPVFDDTAFLPPAGTWCEGLPLTSTPDLPASFTLMAEMVHLDASKVSFQKIHFNSRRKLVRRDWKEITVDTTAVDSGPPYTTIYDFNNGVRYNIDSNLQSCARVSPITMYDDFAEPTPVKRVSPHEFRLAGSGVFFHTKRARVQLAGQRTIRGITTDVYIGLYPDPDKHRNFTVQWFFSKAHWQVYAGASIESGALVRMEVYELDSGNPTVYNVIEFENSAPDYDVFDISPCYTPQQKIHFLLLIKVLQPAMFSSVTPRQIKDRIAEMLAKLITEQNRFAGLQVEYDGKENLYVYGTLLDRSPVDNTDIPHNKPHGMEEAFLFLGGSVRSQISSYIITPEGKNVTLIPARIIRLDFAKDFTTAPPSSPTTTRAPPMPPRKTTPTTVITTPITPKTTPITPKTTPTSTPRSTAPTAKPIKTRAPAPPLTMRPQTPPPCNCASDCPAPTRNSPSRHQTTSARCPVTSQAGQFNSGQKGQSQDKSDSSSSKDVTIGALVGAMIGTLVLGLILGFVATRMYHVMKKLPDVRLVNGDEDLKY